MIGTRSRSMSIALVAVVGAFGLAACGDSDNDTSSASTSGASSSAKKYNMTLITGVKGDEFYITMGCGAQAEAAKMGVALNIQGPDKFDASLETPIVNAVAAKKPDAVLIAPTDSKALLAPIQQLATGGAKIVLVDTTLDQPDVAVSEISSDNTAGGTQAAQALAKMIGSG